MRLKIAGGHLYDPADSWEGEVRDLYVEGDRIVPPLPEVDRVIDAQGQAVLAGGIELRGQVATYGLNYLRLWGSAPSLQELGESYAALGYTHVHEPFLTFYTANYVHRELAALPLVDTSASLVLNLRDLDLWLSSPERWAEVGETLQFLLNQTRSLNLRVVEPYVRYRQDVYAHRMLKTDRALEILAELARGQNLTLTLEATPEILGGSLPEPRAFHLAALGQALTADELVEAALAHLQRGTTGDLGLMNPGAPNPLPRLPVRIDLGLFKPLELCPRGDQAAARRALALALQYQGPNLAFSGASSAQAPVKDYPRLFSWLGEVAARRRDWGDGFGSRQYSLAEWAWATRTLPARLLGLKDRGRLSSGARADVALYDLPPEASPSRWAEHLGRCRTLIKAGEIVLEDFSLVQPRVAKASYYRRTAAEAGPILDEICQYRSFRPENLWVQEELGGPWVGM
jgi:formylmethanofuran dehydrogenase subunit A